MKILTPRDRVTVWVVTIVFLAAVLFTAFVLIQGVR